MRGVAHTSGAISIVNALGCGIGCAAGVDLPVDVEVEMGPTASKVPRWDVASDAETPLVRAALRQALGLLAPGMVVEGRLQVRSEVPAGRGLKSSSAVSSAVVLAVAHALGKNPRPEVVARASADASQAAGVSATGAFDDAMASITGDVVVADNPSRIVLRREPPDPRWCGVVWIPPTPHAAAPSVLAAFAELEEEAREVAALAIAGEYPAALSENSKLVERAMGYDYQTLREELGRRGALAAGVSGLGPAVSAIAPIASVAAVAEGFPTDRGVVRPVVFGRGGGPGGPG